jgi:hypothetical protein
MIALLAAAREPVSTAWLSELAQQDVLDVADALSLWHRFLAPETRDGVERWRILHRTFADFVDAKMGLVQSHKAIAAWCNSPKLWDAREGYARKHRSAHLRAAQAFDELFALADDDTWSDRQLLADPTGATHQADLQEAWLAAESRDRAVCGDTKPVEALGHEIRFALASVTLKGCWRSVSPSTLAAFIRAGRLDAGQALAFVLARLDPGKMLPFEDRSEYHVVAMIRALAPLLRGEHLRRAEAISQTIDDPAGRAGALSILAAHAEDSHRRDLLRRALDAARETSGDLRSEALREVAAQLEPDAAGPILEEARDAALRLLDPGDRVDALVALAAVTTDLIDLPAQALSAAQMVDALSDRAEKLIEVLPLLDDARRRRVTENLMKSVLPEVPTETRVKALPRLLPATQNAHRDSVLALLRRSCRELNGSAAAEALLAASDLVGDAERTALLADAEGSLRSGPVDVSARLGVLAALAYRRPEAERARFIAEIFEEVAKAAPTPDDRLDRLLDLATGLSEDPPTVKTAIVAEAERIARVIAAPTARAGALLRIAVQMDDEDRGQALMREAFSLPGGVLASGGRLPDLLEQCELLCALAERLDGPTRSRASEAAARRAASILSPFEQAAADIARLKVVVPSESAIVAAQIHTRTDLIADPAELAEILVAIAPFVEEPGRSDLLDRATTAARAIEAGAVRHTGTIIVETGRVTWIRASNLQGRPAAALACVARAADQGKQTALLEEAFQRLFETSGSWQAAEIEALAPDLSVAQARALLDGYRTISQDPLRAEAFDRVQVWRTGGPAAAEDDGPQESEGTEGSDVTVSAAALHPHHWFQLTPAPPAAFTFSYDGAYGQKDALERSIVRNYVDDAFANGVECNWDAVVDAQIWSPAWTAAAATLVRRLAQTDSPQAALEAAASVWPDGLPAVVVSALTDLVPHRELRPNARSALDRLENLDPEERALAAAGLLPLLLEPERSTVTEILRAALDEVLTAGADESQVQRLADGAEALSAEQQLAIVQHALRRADDRKDLLATLLKLLPLLERLGGPPTLETMVDSLEAVCRRWG